MAAASSSSTGNADETLAANRKMPKCGRLGMSGPRGVCAGPSCTFTDKRNHHHLRDQDGGHTRASTARPAKRIRASGRRSEQNSRLPTTRQQVTTCVEQVSPMGGGGTGAVGSRLGCSGHQGRRGVNVLVVPSAGAHQHRTGHKHQQRQAATQNQSRNFVPLICHADCVKASPRGQSPTALRDGEGGRGHADR